MLLSAFQTGERPREPRVKVMVPCRLNQAGQWHDACIHNVSSRGLLVASSNAPATGSYVEIRRGTQVIIGRVMWRKDRYFGVRTQDRVSAQTLVDEPRTKRQPSGGSEHRSARRLAHEGNIARRVERSRAIAASLQAAVLVFGGGGVAVFAALEVYDVLARPMQTLQHALGG